MCNPASGYQQRGDQKPVRRVPERVSLIPGRRLALVHRGTDGLAETPAAGPTAGRAGGVRSRLIQGVVVVEVTGRLHDVVEDLDRAIVLALADGPRGVVCDLSAVPWGAGPLALEVLATAGRHVRDWPGIPVLVASPDSQVRESLAAHALGRQLLVTASLFSAVTAVRATPVLDVRTLRLTPHPTAPRAARDFVTRTLLGW